MTACGTPLWKLCPHWGRHSFPCVIFYHLNVGDVIDLGRSKQSSVYLDIGGYHWFTGKMGTHKKNMAVRIDEVCYQAEQRSEEAI